MKLYNSKVKIPLMIFSALVPILWYWKSTHGFLWEVSWYSVFILMLIRPLADIFTSQKWIRKLMPYRKELGILSASIVVTNALYTYIPKGLDFFPYYFSPSYWDLRTPFAYGHIAELVGVVLLITSNKFSVKKLKKKWKPIQKTAHIYFYSAAVLLTFYGKTAVLVTAIITAVITMIATIKKRIPKKK